MGLSYSDTLDIEKIDTTSTGRVNKIKINGNTFTGGQMIDKLNLRSSFFEITKDGENVVINTKEWVSMEQKVWQGQDIHMIKYLNTITLVLKLKKFKKLV